MVECEAAVRATLGGSIVSATSVSGIRGNAGRAAYEASKGGMEAPAQGPGAEWAGEGIRLNAVAPGPVDTPLAGRVYDAATRRECARLLPLQRYGEPVEVAAATFFLLDGRASSFITGRTICVDGGFVSPVFGKECVNE